MAVPRPPRKQRCWQPSPRENRISTSTLQLSEAEDSASLQQRRQLEQQREKVLQTELGPERYQAYVLNKTALFPLGAWWVVQRAGATVA